jgi:hypothetical protein
VRRRAVYSRSALSRVGGLEEIGLTPCVLEVFRSADSAHTLAIVGDRIVVLSARRVAREGRDLGWFWSCVIAPISNH